jgi:hypothetical protein
MTTALDVCRPNISAAGRRRRLRVAQVAAVASVVGLGVMIATGASPAARATLVLPAFLAALSALQVRRNTCVKHAATGTFEADDFSTTSVSEADASASRRVASTIWRDAGLFTLLALTVSVASAWLPARW